VSFILEEIVWFVDRYEARDPRHQLGDERRFVRGVAAGDCDAHCGIEGENAGALKRSFNNANARPFGLDRLSGRDERSHHVSSGCNRMLAAIEIPLARRSPLHRHGVNPSWRERDHHRDERADLPDRGNDLSTARFHDEGSGTGISKNLSVAPSDVSRRHRDRDRITETHRRPGDCRRDDEVGGWLGGTRASENYETSNNRDEAHPASSEVTNQV
jgi:hypothetical protein